MDDKTDPDNIVFEKSIENPMNEDGQVDFEQYKALVRPYILRSLFRFDK